MNQEKLIHSEKGQSMIEFILTLSFSLGIIFLFTTLATNLTSGYLVHYVTFNASRTYLSYDGSFGTPENSIGPARGKAIEVFNRYGLDKIGIPSSGFTILPPGPSAQGNALMVGATTRFEKPISNFKVVGGSEKAVFLSESLLGKEPTRAECFQMVCEAMGIPNCGDTYDITVFDNGC